MRVLLDTCVLSELYRPAPLESVRAAVNRLPDEYLFLSVITLGEIGKGIALLPDSRRRQDSSAWFANLQHAHTDRILSVDPETAAIWGEITAVAQRRGVVLASADGLIAGTALRHGQHLMTRNAKDIQNTGVLLQNPWDET
ncbi:type II toxin-antitoxin system VapC family toxin [Thiocapsa sp.]|uniref:type II toxin-antitoxin system VapC family toxin n=1 Tax=Thiocapsa sp. TaxID=2024551 RepID=UPI0025CCADBD|nr:type II toxin-antitoxin system VapC family toxin [Thiocapsa sp.]